jgi:hypothetical protein
LAPSTPADGASTSHAVSSNAAGVASGTGTRKDEEEDLDAVQYRLEMLGYRVGQGLVERSERNTPGEGRPGILPPPSLLSVSQVGSVTDG